ncbi:uncharacterized protein LOC143460618 isoform X2 [Clavelina lepadiformis]|uniref:uncharacterized protein LOC143460618 isoform X2 n=1 Tax=Clavelina lepadiformis TaxID=159417 RepID=UPI0040412836
MFKGLLPGELNASSDSEITSEEEQPTTLPKNSLKLPVQDLDSSKIQSAESELAAPPGTKSNKFLSGDKFPADINLNRKRKFPTTSTSVLKDEESTDNFTFEKKYKQEISIKGIKSDIEKAIKAGKVEKASALSDRLAELEKTKQAEEVKVAQGFVKNKLEQEKRKVARKRKKLNWTFETKKRWETKSNM